MTWEFYPYNNFYVCLTTKEKCLIFLCSHTLIISLKGSNALLFPFYFFLHTQLSLGCLLFSKWLTLGCSLFFLVWLPLSLLLVFSKDAVPYSLLPLVFLPNENPFYSLLVSRSIFPLPKGRTLGPKPKSSNSLYLCLFIRLFFYSLLN